MDESLIIQSTHMDYYVHKITIEPSNNNSQNKYLSSTVASNLATTHERGSIINRAFSQILKIIRDYLRRLKY